MNLESYRQQLRLDGSDLSYLDIGQGPVLLLGHSYLWDAHMWVNQLEVLSKSYRCIVPDLWGHGHSGAVPTTTRSLRDVADNMLSLMDSLAIQDFSILGLSVGGMWGAELVLKAPSRVKSLVLMNTFIGFEPEVTRDKYYGMLDSIKQLGCVPAPMIEAITPLFFADNATEKTPKLVEEFQRSLAGISSDNIESIVKIGRMTFGRRDTTEDAHLLTLPCLIMSGTQDKARSVLEGFLMHDVIDGSDFVHIQDAGHISAHEQAKFINDKLMAFFEKHLA